MIAEASVFHVRKHNAIECDMSTFYKDLAVSVFSSKDI